MLCQNCKQNEASISYMQSINGAVTKISLCENCYNEKKLNQIDINIPFSIKDLFASLMDKEDISGYVAEKEKSCPKCHSTYSRFQSTGKLGCETCYDTFKDELSPLIRRVQIKGEHMGKIPEHACEYINRKKELIKLKTEMAYAIQDEEFEKAAELRDKIKLLEKEG